MLGRNRSFFEVFKIDELLELVTKLIETKLKLAMLDLEEKGINMMAKLLSGIMLGVLLLVFLFFLNFAVAYFLNEIFESTYKGFAVVAGFYLFLFVLLLVLRKKVAFKDMLLKAIQNNHDKQNNGKR